MKRNMLVFGSVLLVLVMSGCATPPHEGVTSPKAKTSPKATRSQLGEAEQQDQDKISAFVAKVKNNPALLTTTDESVRREAQDISDTVKHLEYPPSQAFMIELVADFNVFNGTLKSVLRADGFDDKADLLNDSFRFTSHYNADVVAQGFCLVRQLWLFSFKAFLSKGPSDPIARYGVSMTEAKNAYAPLLFPLTREQNSPDENDRLAAWKVIAFDLNTFSFEESYKFLCDSKDQEKSETVKAAADETLAEMKAWLEKKR